ncbi:hypothetical protein NE237_003790 [Protea cynaroides]|uniref:Uncharacterized protein n=1 Tax=Protea cynaroides TaxID=273540 RepID=A0A9Q0KHR6_9MAGN|nr:hypothetical protein NE237_003790 [Protea cynaroides]
MGSLFRLCSSLLLVITLLLIVDLHFAVSAETPQFSPVPAPESGGSNSPSPKSDAPAPGPSTDFNSPPSPPPADMVPTYPPPTPAPSPVTSPSPSLSPSDASDINQGAANNETADSQVSSSGGGLKGGPKAGIAIAVILGACIVGLVAIIYKKRKENVRRSQYSYAVGRELL